MLADGACLSLPLSFLLGFGWPIEREGEISAPIYFRSKRPDSRKIATYCCCKN